LGDLWSMSVLGSGDHNTAKTSKAADFFIPPPPSFIFSLLLP
jgi:hypothetical protein